MLSTIQGARALALVGMPGAGKTLCAKYLESKGYFQFRFGKIVVDEVIQRGWSVTPENERIVREALRAKEGIDAIAKRALPHLKQALQEHQSIVIDGLYGFTEYKLLRSELDAEIIVVAIFTPRHLRYDRLLNRAERPLTAAEALDRDYQEIQTLEKGGPIALADFTLMNAGSSDDLLAALDQLLGELAFHP